MKKQIELTIRPEEINLPEILLLKSSQYLKTDKDNISSVILLKDQLMHEVNSSFSGI